MGLLYHCCYFNSEGVAREEEKETILHLEKAFDRGPQEVVWWVMCKLAVDELTCKGSTINVM